MRPRIKRIAISGFRGFGKVTQVAVPAETVSVFWGGNSNGKTSFAEAIEFVLTGGIARRELLGGAKDEFADSLRNAHLDDGVIVAVELHVEDSAGVTHTIKRTLLEDYRRGNAAQCTTKLEINGKPAAEGDLIGVVGLTFFPAPLQAPVLSQHSLGFLFSSSPTDRAAYFRAVLDTQDLEDFRQAVAALKDALEKPSGPEIVDITALGRVPGLFAALHALLQGAKAQADVEAAFDGALTMLLTDAGADPAATLAGKVQQVRDELARRRALVFPVQSFAQKPFAPWADTRQALAETAASFDAERSKCDAEAMKLVGLFEAALKVPDLASQTEDADCPLCGTAAALTPPRITWIKEQAKSTADYKNALKALTTVLDRLAIALQAVEVSAVASLPAVARQTRAARRGAGFTVDAIKGLGVEATLVTDWLKDLRPAWRAAHRVRRATRATAKAIDGAVEDVAAWTAASDVATALHEIVQAQAVLINALQSLTGPARRLEDAVNERVDQSNQVVGWEALTRLAGDPEGALLAIGRLAAFAASEQSIEKALSDIDKGVGRVQDDKFTDLSDAVRGWWDRLRPDEATYFDAVQRRSGRTRRNIDIRAGLSLKDDKSDPKFRDAVAVFSQSQLHCLGLAIFLARASTEKVGFIVLDDPVLTSDEDYRPNFASTVIEGLLNEGMQVIVVTQDYSTAKDIQTRWAFRGAARFHIVRNDPLIGAEIRNEDDDLAAMMARAHPFCNSEDPEQRKAGGTKVREAIERFCKMVLVKDRQGKGETLASVTDYDGQNFGSYSAKVIALLTKDNSHPGKLQAAHNYATPGPHDDAPPPKGQLKMALGDLKTLKAAYLD